MEEANSAAIKYQEYFRGKKEDARTRIL